MIHTTDGASCWSRRGRSPIKDLGELIVPKLTALADVLMVASTGGRSVPPFYIS